MVTIDTGYIGKMHDGNIYIYTYRLLTVFLDSSKVKHLVILVSDKLRKSII